MNAIVDPKGPSLAVVPSNPVPEGARVVVVPAGPDLNREVSLSLAHEVPLTTSPISPISPMELSTVDFLSDTNNAPSPAAAKGLPDVPMLDLPDARALARWVLSLRPPG